MKAEKNTTLRCVEKSIINLVFIAFCFTFSFFGVKSLDKESSKSLHETRLRIESGEKWTQKWRVQSEGEEAEKVSINRWARIASKGKLFHDQQQRERRESRACVLACARSFLHRSTSLIDILRYLRYIPRDRLDSIYFCLAACLLLVFCLLS